MQYNKLIHICKRACENVKYQHKEERLLAPEDLNTYQ
jgi:hypothetical protein